MRTRNEPRLPDLSQSAPPEGTPEYYEYLHISTLVDRLKERIAADRQKAERLASLLPGANAASFRNQEDIADMAQRLGFLKTDVTRREVELAYWQIRLQRLQSFSSRKSQPN